MKDKKSGLLKFWNPAEAFRGCHYRSLSYFEKIADAHSCDRRTLLRYMLDWKKTGKVFSAGRGWYSDIVRTVGVEDDYIKTDEGLYGWGECTLGTQEMALEGCIADFGRLIVGRDAHEIERMMFEVYRDCYWKGGPLMMTFYLALDGYGPAANVTGDSAIALVADSFFGKAGDVRTDMV